MRSQIAAACIAVATVSGCAANPAAPGVNNDTSVTPSVVLESRSGRSGTTNWVGQSFVIPGTATYSSLRFSWETWTNGLAPYVPTAFGKLYLLNQEYLGAPSALNASTPGVFAVSDRVESGEYIFNAALTIAAGQTIWAYSDTRGDFLTTDSDVLANGRMYVSGVASLAFRPSETSSPVLPPAQPKPEPVYRDANFTLKAAKR